MADLNDIQKKIRDEFADRARNDTKLSEIRKKIQEGADYRIAEQYAERSGQILSEVLRSNITSENFPVGSVEEIAGLIIPPMEQNHHFVGNATAKVQKNLNSKGNLGLKPVIPEFDRKAGMHMAGRMAQYESFEETEWMLGEPIVTDSISHVDEMLRENADMQYKAGLRPKIIRTAEPECCEWCASLAGEYDYAEVADKGNPVYQRHNNCRCEVTYDPGNGKMFDAHSKKELDVSSINKRLIKFQRNQTEDRNRSIHYGKTEFFNSDRGTIKARKIDSMGYNNLYISENVSLSPRDVRFINKQITLAKEVHNITNNCSIPIVIIPHNKNLASYNPRLNILYLSQDMCNERFIRTVQIGYACPDDPRSTIVHELFHWKDAEDYRKTGREIEDATFKSKYSIEQRERSKKALIDAGIDLSDLESIRKNISQYAYEKIIMENDYEEAYTEYRTIRLLEKG